MFFKERCSHVRWVGGGEESIICVNLILQISLSFTKMTSQERLFDKKRYINNTKNKAIEQWIWQKKAKHDTDLSEFCGGQSGGALSIHRYRNRLRLGSEMHWTLFILFRFIFWLKYEKSLVIKSASIKRNCFNINVSYIQFNLHGCFTSIENLVCLLVSNQ